MKKLLFILLGLIGLGVIVAQGPGPIPPQILYDQVGVWSANQFFTSVDNVVYCDQYAILNLCYAALPGGHGKMILPPNTTIDQTTSLAISTSNVTMECPSWNTVIQRDSSLTGAQQLISVTGTNFLIRDCTIDGGSFANTGIDLNLDGANDVAEHIQAINSGNISVSVSGANSILDDSTITGLGSTTIGGYGVWAINHQTVSITNNKISFTKLDGIGFDGFGSQVVGNHVFSAHCYNTGGGGVIATYPNAVNVVIANNTIGPGCSYVAHGIELNGFSETVTGNAISHQWSNGISVDTGHGPGGVNITANTIMDSSALSSNDDYGINFQSSSVSTINITGNILGDDQTTISTACVGTVAVGAQTCTVTSGGTTGLEYGSNISIAGAGVAGAALVTYLNSINTLGNTITWNTATSTATTSPAVTGVATQQYGIHIPSGAYNQLNITGNMFFGNVAGPISNGATGVNQIIKNNIGIDDIIPSVASAAALAFPLNPIIALTGTTGVTSITGPVWDGREVKMIPAGSVTFTAGNNIANTVTTTQNVPLTATYASGAGLWYLK